KKVSEVVLASADVDAAECAVTLAVAELSSVKSRAAAMQAGWAKADDKSSKASLSEAERKSSDKAVFAQRHAELAKAVYEVADAKRRILKTPDQKATIDTELAKARDSRNKSMKMMDAPIGKDDRYSPIEAARAAPTRFAATTKDDEVDRWSGQSTGRRKALAD